MNQLPRQRPPLIKCANRRQNLAEGHEAGVKLLGLPREGAWDLGPQGAEVGWLCRKDPSLLPYFLSQLGTPSSESHS